MPGDADLDGRVDVNDLTVVLADYGQTGVWSQGNFITGDSQVDINDLTIVLANYGQTIAPIRHVWAKRARDRPRAGERPFAGRAGSAGGVGDWPPSPGADVTMGGICWPPSFPKRSTRWLGSWICWRVK